MSTRRLGLLVAMGVLAIVLAGCGGGGGFSFGEPAAVEPPAVQPPAVDPPAVDPPAVDPPAPPPAVQPAPVDPPAPPAPPAPTFQVRTTVVDGPIGGARVCMDTSGNGTCDVGEPATVSGADGAAVLAVPPELEGKFPLLAEVGTDAVDLDYGPIETPFVLLAPADRPGVISPLSTLVHAVSERSGLASAAAEQVLRARIGTRASLFEDFTRRRAADAQRLRALARMLVLAAQRQGSALQPAVGTIALDGRPIVPGDVHRGVRQQLVHALPAMLARLADARWLAAAEADRAAVLATLAAEVVAAPGIGLGVAAMPMLAAAARAPDVSGEPVAPSASLTTLHYTDSRTWFRRALTASTLQNTPGAGGGTRFVDRRLRSAPSWGTSSYVGAWSFGEHPAAQSDLHWNGADWVRCGLNFESSIARRDAFGRSQFNACDGFQSGVVQRSTLDISGRSMLQVYEQVRAAGYGNLSITGAAAVLGSAAFPAESKLMLEEATVHASAPAYGPWGSTHVRNAYYLQVLGDPVACRQGDSNPSAPVPQQLEAPTLESMVGFNPGTPCVLLPETLPNGAASGARNEWWGQSTLGLGVLGSAPTSPASTTYYTGNTLLRAAFDPDGGVRYFACQQRATDGSARNCDQIGAGSFAVEVVGDARVLGFSDAPPLVASLDMQRVFIEREGKVFEAWRYAPVLAREARLNLAAANALGAVLALPLLEPEIPQSPRAGSFEGGWSGTGFRLDLSAGAGTLYFNSQTLPVAAADDYGGVRYSRTSPTPITRSLLVLSLDFEAGTVTGHSLLFGVTSQVTGTRH